MMKVVSAVNSEQTKKRGAALLRLILGLLAVVMAMTGVASADPGDGRVVYGQGTSATSQQRAYTDTAGTFGAASGTTAASANIQRVVNAASPVKNERIVGQLNNTGTLDILCFNGSTWSADITGITVGTAGTQRRLDIAYEQLSGDVLLVYSKNATTNEIGYRTKPGTAGCGSANWSSESTLDPANTLNVVAWVELAERPDSDEIAMAYSDLSAQGALNAMIWDGTTWGNEPSAVLQEGATTGLERVAAVGDVKAFDIEYESTSGEVLVVWGQNGVSGPFYNTFAGSPIRSWGTAAQFLTAGDQATQIDLSREPGTDRILFASISAGTDDLQASVWNGSAWGPDAIDADRTAGSWGAGRQPLATGWVKNGSSVRGVVVYGDTAGDAALDYIYFDGDGNAWRINAQNGFDFPTTPALNTTAVEAQIQMDMDPFNSNKLMVLFAQNTAPPTLYAKRLTYTGTGAGTDTTAPGFGWSNTEGGAALESNLSTAAATSAYFTYNRPLRVDLLIEGNGDASYDFCLPGGLPANCTGSGGLAAKDAPPATITNYTTTVQNEDIFARTYNLYWSNPGAGWTVTLTPGASSTCDGSAAEDTVSPCLTQSIPAGGSAAFTLNVTAPSGGTEFQDISVSAIPVVTGKTDSVTARAGLTPNAPSGLTGTPQSSTTIQLTWTDNSAVESNYRLERAVSDGTCNGTGEIYSLVSSIIAANATSYTDGSSLVVGNIYCYRLQAYNTAGSSAYAYSGEVRFLVPNAPSSLTVVVPAGTTGERLLSLTWTDASNNETGFQVERVTTVIGATCSALSGYSLITTILRNSTQTTSTGGAGYYVSTGLTPATYYCYRVRAFNTQGFSAYRYPTTPVDTSVSTNAPAADGTAPAAVTNLAVAAGSQRNSAISFTWTAPGDDVSTGQAATYDLRYSMTAISAGNFGTACTSTTAATLNATRPTDCVVPVINLAPPQPANSTEFRTIMGRINTSNQCDVTLTDATRPLCLIPNTIYYFALKTLDEASPPNTSLINTNNPVGGDNPTDGSLSGRTALRTGFNLISVPRSLSGAIPAECTTAGDTPACVFGDDHGSNVLSRWNSTGSGVTNGCYEASPTTGSDCSPQVGISTVGTALGYFLMGGANTGVIDAPSNSTETDLSIGTNCGVANSYQVAVELGWNMVGNPFRRAQTLSAVYVCRAGVAQIFDDTDGNLTNDAVSLVWVGLAIYQFNGSTYVPLTIDDTLPARFEPWQAYWVQVLDASVTHLVFPQPP